MRSAGASGSRTQRSRDGRVKYRATAILLGAVAVAAVIVFLTSRHDAGTPGPTKLEGDIGSAKVREQIANFEPFAYDAGREENLLERAKEGEAEPIYLKSPDGVGASATRIEKWGPSIKRAAEAAGVDPDTLEAVLFLESAGRPDVVAGTTPDAAVGLAQILPGTAVDLLGMKVDLARSKALSRQIARDGKRALEARTSKRRRAAARRIPKLEAQRRRIDQRFDPERSIEGAARYLQIAQKRFGREDLAVASYHMGIGNLEQVLSLYGAGKDVSYPRIYFDSSPLRNPRTYAKLSSFGDDSSNYFFRVMASKDILALHRDDPEKLTRQAKAHQKKASAEEVLRPEQDNPPYEDAGKLKEAYADGELVRLPDKSVALGYKIDPGMGSLAPKLKEKKALYRGLRADALATLLYVAKEVRKITGGTTPIVVTSTVRDKPYQRVLQQINGEATSGFSLHTTGYAFDILRPRNRARHRAIEFVLGRLRALEVLDWVYEPAAFHVTVGPDGQAFRALLDALLKKP